MCETCIYKVPNVQPFDWLFDIEIELFLAQNEEGDWFMFMGGIKTWMMTGSSEKRIFDELLTKGRLVSATRLEFLLKTGLDFHDSLE